MNSMLLLIPLGVLLAGVAMWAFFWSVNNGQYDDMDAPAHSILFDDDDDMIPPESRITPEDTPTADDNSLTKQAPKDD
ncbi:cbb3-type cytochrome oxidase assembly protein CcoS [Nitrincola alkalilacustris]|uniref:cbb3-type cytochrome oxidase assembly protein CcoS n=1 Tax=Nitrincola alkalilacustris TaxID=1571224 RepID=UPI00124E9B32|nr:cbb3-type cytochrome oxidase assembly protein CcoS [Nitrincola alkalilacustris]